MKLFFICMLAFVWGAHATGYSQQQTVSLDLKQCDVNTLFQEIWKQTGLRFVYNEYLRGKPKRGEVAGRDFP